MLVFVCVGFENVNTGVAFASVVKVIEIVSLTPLNSYTASSVYSLLLKSPEMLLLSTEISVFSPPFVNVRDLIFPSFSQPSAHKNPKSIPVWLILISSKSNVVLVKKLF